MAPSLPLACKLALVAVVASVCLLPVRAFDDETGAVINLTEDNFDETTASGPWLLFFHAPWCGHCKHMAPAYVEAALEVEGSGFSFGSVDCTAQKDLAHRFDVKSFPTVFLWRDGQKTKYRGERTAPALASFAQRMSEAPWNPVRAADDLTESQNGLETTFVFVGGSAGENFDQFEAAAYRFQADSHMRFLQLDAASVAKVLPESHRPASTPSVIRVCRQCALSEFADFDALDSETPLADWISARQWSDVPQINSGSFESVIRVLGKDKWALVAALDQQRADVMTPLLDDFRSLVRERLSGIDVVADHVVFAWIDAAEYKDYVSRFSISPSDAPTFFILDAANSRWFLPEGGVASFAVGKNDGSAFRLDVEMLEEFLQAAMKGTLTAHGAQWWHPGMLWKKFTETVTTSFTQNQLVMLAGLSAVLVGLFFVWALCFAFREEEDEEAAAAAVAATDGASKKKVQKKAGAAKSANSKPATEAKKNK